LAELYAELNEMQNSIEQK
jgi:hypothetical protein